MSRTRPSLRSAFWGADKGFEGVAAAASADMGEFCLHFLYFYPPFRVMPFPDHLGTGLVRPSSA